MNMTRSILIALVLLLGGTASAQSDRTDRAKETKKPKELREAGIQAQESEDLRIPNYHDIEEVISEPRSRSN